MDEVRREETTAEAPAADGPPGERQPGALLADAYPRERDRVRAVRWLGWVAHHWGDEPVAWWEIPAGVPGQWLARAWLAARAVIVTAALAAATGFTLWVAIALGFLVLVISGSTGARLPSVRRQRAPRPGRPRRAGPRWPRGLGEIALLGASLIPVVTFLPVLVSRWTEPARGDAVQEYRADRRVTTARCAAWLGSAGLVAAIALGAGVSPGAWLGAGISLAVGAGLLAGLAAGPYPVVKLTELILLAQWRQPVSLCGVLADAAARQVLKPQDDRWEFRDASVRAALAAVHAAELAERNRAREARATRATGARARLLAALSAEGTARVRADLAAGVALFPLLLGLTLGHGPGHSERWGIVILFAVIAAAAGLLGYAYAPRPLRRAVTAVQWTTVNVAPFSRRTHLAVTAAGVAAAALLIATAGPALAGLAAAILPAVTVAVCGGWVLLVTRRLSRPGSGRRSAWWRRRLVVVLAAVAVPAAVYPLLRNQLAARYTLAYQRQLEAEGEQAAYAEISGQFTTAPANQPVLAGIVERVHDIDHPAGGDDDATGTEADIARRVGELQAATLLAAGPAPAAAEPGAADATSRSASPLRTTPSPEASRRAVSGYRPRTVTGRCSRRRPGDSCR